MGNLNSSEPYEYYMTTEEYWGMIFELRLYGSYIPEIEYSHKNFCPKPDFMEEKNRHIKKRLTQKTKLYHDLG